MTVRRRGRRRRRLGSGRRVGTMIVRRGVATAGGAGKRASASGPMSVRRGVGRGRAARRRGARPRRDGDRRGDERRRASDRSATRQPAPDAARAAPTGSPTPQRHPVPAAPHRAPRRRAGSGTRRRKRPVLRRGQERGAGAQVASRPRARPRRRPGRHAAGDASTEAADELARHRGPQRRPAPRINSPRRPTRSPPDASATRCASCARCATPIPTRPRVRELLGLVHYRLGHYPAAREGARGVRRPHRLRRAAPRPHGLLPRAAPLPQGRRAVGASSPTRRRRPRSSTEGRIVARRRARRPTAGSTRRSPLLERRGADAKRAQEHHLRLWYALADLYERAGDIPRAARAVRPRRARTTRRSPTSPSASPALAIASHLPRGQRPTSACSADAGPDRPPERVVSPGRTVRSLPLDRSRRKPCHVNRRGRARRLFQPAGGARARRRAARSSLLASCTIRPDDRRRGRRCRWSCGTRPPGVETLDAGDEIVVVGRVRRRFFRSRRRYRVTRRDRGRAASSPGARPAPASQALLRRADAALDAPSVTYRVPAGATRCTRAVARGAGDTVRTARRRGRDGTAGEHCPHEHESRGQR